MRRLSKSLVACLSIVSGTLLVGTGAAANGCGIPHDFATNTYSISSPAHFTLLASCDPTATFNLTADVNLTGITVARRTNFTGTFDGNGYTISNLTVSGSGLFDVGSAGATFSRVHFANATVMGGGTGGGTGALVGKADGPVTISNSSFSGSVNAGAGTTQSVGGFIGETTGNVTISNSYVVGSVRGFGLNGLAAGFVGRVSTLHPTQPGPVVSLSSNYMIGSITGGVVNNSLAAGFLGNVRGSVTIRKSFVRATLVGGTVTNSWVNGFIGSTLLQNGDRAILEDSYFAGSRTGGTENNTYAYGIADGDPSLTVTSVFCVSSCGNSVGQDVAHLSLLRTEISNAAWDFTNTWCYSHGHNDGYPVLRALSFGPNAAWGNCVPTPVATAPAPPPTPETTTPTTTSTTTVSCAVASVQSSDARRLQPGRSIVVRDGSVVKSGVSGSASVLGGAVRVRGRGISPGSSVDVWLVEGRHFLGTLMTNASGVVSGRLDLPVEVDSGVQTLQMVERNCNTVGTVVSLGVNVSRKTTLPATGGGANPLTWLIGILALVVGVTLRRKRVV